MFKPQLSKYFQSMLMRSFVLVSMSIYSNLSSAQSEALFIDKSGKVGIGTNTPNSQLDVVGNMEVSGNIKAANLGRRDWRPYGNPSFYWSGLPGEAKPQGNLSARGSALFSFDKIPYWAGKALLSISDLRKEDISNTIVPADCIYITVPATSDCVNSLLLSTVEDRWSSISVWLCKQDGSDPVKLAVSGSNISNSQSGDRFAYMVGPFNVFKEFGTHTWLPFPVTKQQVMDYSNNGTLKFMVKPGPYNADADRILLSGIALVPNLYGFYQQSARTLHWGLNAGFKSDSRWQGDSTKQGPVIIDSLSTGSVFIKVVDPEKDLLVTFYKATDESFLGSINVSLDKGGIKYYPATGIQGIASSLYGSVSLMRPESIIIPASVLKSHIETSRNGVANMMRLYLNNPGIVSYKFWGIDTEIY